MPPMNINLRVLIYRYKITKPQIRILVLTLLLYGAIISRLFKRFSNTVTFQCSFLRNSVIVVSEVLKNVYDKKNCS